MVAKVKFGWAYRRENRAALLARSMKTYATWRASVKDGYDWEPTPEYDPREYLLLHSQGNIGSCQGNSLADAGEHSLLLEHGVEVQLSRFWAYMVSQEADGINGDSGSTLEGGGRAARDVGICLEDSFSYPSTYTKGKAFYRANREKLLPEAENYKLLGEVPISTWSDAVRFLQSRTGPIQTGIMWGSSMDVGWEITKYTPGDGGHSTLFCGYLRVRSWPDEIGLLMKNSWGLGWGRDGYGLVAKPAFESMVRTKYNLFVGRSGAQTPVSNRPPDL